MQLIKLLIFAVLFILGTTIFSYGQVVKDIIPMHSTCDNVKKILGVETCKKSHEFYDLENESVSIGYSTEVCQKAYLKHWNISIGTVLSVIRFPKKPILLKDVPVDLNTCKISEGESDVPGTLTYSCEKVGTTISVFDGYVYQLMYTPIPEDSRLLCKVEETNPAASPRKMNSKNCIKNR